MTQSYLGQSVGVKIDRPLGSTHPNHPAMHYPVNYGFIPGTLAPDGEELDAYVLGVDEPLESFEGICIAVIHRLDDQDDKLIVVPAGIRLTDEEIRAQTYFQEQYFESVIWRERKNRNKRE